MVQCHAKGDTCAAIVRNDSEAIEPECPHHLELIERHRPLRVSGVLVTAGRLLTVAVARRSAHTTVNRSAKAGATRCHMTWVWGYP